MSIKPGDLRRHYVKSYRELLEAVDSRLRKTLVDSGSLRDILVAKLDVAYRVVEGELEGVIRALRDVASMDPFFRELYREYVGEDVGESIARFQGLLKAVRRIYSEQAEKLRTTPGRRQLTQEFKGGIGRLLSVYRRNRGIVERVKKYLSEVSRMPDVTGDYRVVISGVPQVGKSTLLSKLTRARPEIGSYPFTTRSIIAGHIDVEPYGRIVLIDSPGVLDTPLEEKNIVERKAVLAVKHLADHLLFVVDANPSFYYSLREQLGVYRRIKEVIGDKPVTVVINKIDTLSTSMLEEASRVIREETGVEPLGVSALEGLNLDVLRERLVKYFMERSLRR